MPDEYVTIDVSITAETQKAYKLRPEGLVSLTYRGKEYWMPKSQCRIKFKNGEEARIEAAEWILYVQGIEFSGKPEPEPQEESQNETDECPF